MSFEIHKKRREKLLEILEKCEAVAIIASAFEVKRNHDVDYPFRQDSSFHYLTGFDEPDSILVLNPFEQKRETLFLRERDPKMELWTGRRLGVDKACEKLSMDQSFKIELFEEKLSSLTSGASKWSYDLASDFTLSSKHKLCDFIQSKINTSRNRSMKLGSVAVSGSLEIKELLSGMRAFKDDSELASLQQAQVVTNMAHRAAMAYSAPGVGEHQLLALMESVYHFHQDCGTAYNSIVAGGENALILHYVDNNCQLSEGDLLLIDSGAESSYYAADITRTFPVNGVFTPAQKRIYEIVLEAQKKSCEHIRPGLLRADFHTVACEVLVQGLIDLKILKGSVSENMDTGEFKKYYPHGTGHLLGLDVHDIVHGLHFEKGMVTTNEPGLYLPADDENVPAEFRGIGIRIEDNYILTDDGHENLSVSIPKEIEEVENACRDDFRKFLPYITDPR